MQSCSGRSAQHPVGAAVARECESFEETGQAKRERTDAAALVCSTAELTEALTSSPLVSCIFFWPVAIRLRGSRPVRYSPSREVLVHRPTHPSTCWRALAAASRALAT